MRASLLFVWPCALAVHLPVPVLGQANYTPYSFTTLAGLAGTTGSTDGTGSVARFNQPLGVAVDSAGNVYVADTVNETIRKVTPAGVVTTLAGLAGSDGSADGTGSAARFHFPFGGALDSTGNLYVADQNNQTIRKVTPAGVVTTLAGLAGSYGSADGTGSAARFFNPNGVAVDSAGNVYVADTENCTIRKVTPAGVVTTLAGLAGSQGSADGTGSRARFAWPNGVAVESAGNLYVADPGNATIRKVTPAGVVTTLAGLAGSYGSADGTGHAARFIYPSGLAVDSAGNIYVADEVAHTIRKVTPGGVVTTLAGLARSPGSADGTGSAARFYAPFDVVVDGAGNLYVADTGNNTIRKGIPATTATANLRGSVVATDTQGRSLGPLAGATVTVTGVGAATTDASGAFSFSSVNPGTVSVTASMAGYYPVTRTGTLAAGETRYETFQLLAQSGSTSPQAYDVGSPNGKHFIPGMPGSLTFQATVVWNGSAGQVYFNMDGTRYPAQVTDLGGGLARATLTIPAPTAIGVCSELTIEVANGQGQSSSVNAGIYFHPLPGIIAKWYRDSVPWRLLGSNVGYSEEVSGLLWKAEIPSGLYSSSASFGLQKALSFDPVAGTLTGSRGGFGTFNQKLEFSDVENLGEGRLDVTGTLTIGLGGCDTPTITPGWEVKLSGKAGIGAPAVLVVDVIFPGASPAIHWLLSIPVVKDVVGALKLRLYFIGAGSLSGQYQGGRVGDCFLGATSISTSVTVGLEGEAALEVFGAEAGIYAGGTGTPEFQICPDLSFQGVTLRAYVGVFASAWLFEYRQEVGTEVHLGPSSQPSLLGFAQLYRETPNGVWHPIGNSLLRWGEANRLVASRQQRRLKDDSGSGQEKILENVTKLAAPSILAGPSTTFILFALHDAQKPWYAATDIGTVRQTNSGLWSQGRIVDDQIAEFTPKVARVGSNTALAAWTRVSGDVSGATNPVQVVPHLEVVAAWLDQNTATWSAPQQLTTNSVVDRDPLPVVFGATQGILWIQNAADSSIGNSTNGDRLMFSQWDGSGWSVPQTLWSGPKGILGLAFVADSGGEGHAVFAVDEDGNLDTRTDRELYALSIVGGVWQPPTRLTNDAAEDAMPVLVAPNGVPMCVWSASNTVTYTTLNAWNPKPVFSEYTLANQAPTLDGVTLPGGAAIAYAVQGSNGVDIVASFYDANLDRWSLPRQLTADEDVESALAMAFDGTNVAIAFQKTQTLRTNVDVVINGQTNHLQNIPQPGRTDLYILRHKLGNDVAVVPDSLIVDPPNPMPGSNASIMVTVENRGDLPLQGVQVVFFDGDPANGGVQIGAAQTITNALVGGVRQQVAVLWLVPPSPNAHSIFVVVDPGLSLDDRDRSNNVASMQTVLPDLAIATCWSSEVSMSQVALVARVFNSGAMYSGPCEIAWRLGTADGEEIGRCGLDVLMPRQINEIAYVWDTSGRQFSSPFVTVYAVVDVRGVVQELDKSNNTYAQTVQVIPSWVPRLIEVKLPNMATVKLTVEAGNYPVSSFAVESTGSLASQIQWTVEANAAITNTAPGRFEVQLSVQGKQRFYRIRATQ